VNANRYSAFPRTVAAAVLIGSIGWVSLGWSAQGEGPAPRTVVLRPARGPSLRIDFDYTRGKALPAFENEPALPDKTAARGLIPTVPPTPFLRNLSEKLLYLKVDHDRNFSEGSLVTYKSRYDGHVVFDDLAVFTRRESLAIPYTVRLYTYETVCAGWFLVESGWEGQFDLDGEMWTIGIVDNLDGRIDGNDLLYLRGPGKLTPVCPAAETLFFAGRTFHLDLAFLPLGSEIALQATFTELHPPLGELHIEANGSRHVRLRSDTLTVLLDDPAGTVALPVGVYRVEDCILCDEQTRWAGPTFVAYEPRLSVQAGQTAALRLGGPLTNTVEVSRDRNLLRLDYRLIGAGGERYSYYNWKGPPSFTISKGPLRLGGGTFPFG